MITGVQLQFATHELVDKLAAVSLNDSVLYEKRVPKRSGANDPRLGPLDRGTLCETCHKKMEDCQGHCGKLEVPAAWPLFYWVALEAIKKILECTCYFCKRLLIPPGSLRREYICRTYSTKTRLREMAKACSEMTYCGCPPKDLKFLKSVGIAPLGPEDDKKKKSEKKKQRTFDPRVSCGRRKPVFRSKKKFDLAISATFYLEKGQEAPRFNPATIYNLLCGISDEDAIAMGFSPDRSPLKALMTWAVPVPSTHIRFPVPGASERPAEDDITLKLNNMTKIRNKLGQALKKEPNPARSFFATYIWEHDGGRQCRCESRYLWKIPGSDTPVECKCKQPMPGCPCFSSSSSSSSSSSLPVAPASSSGGGGGGGGSRVGMIANAIHYKKKEKRDKSAVELWCELQSEYNALATGEHQQHHQQQQPQHQQQQQTSNRPAFGLRGIKSRLIGKGGRVRGNMAGKRQDFSARTVISGSMDIDIDEVGVPLHFCRILTKEETVTDINRSYLQHLLRIGEVNRIRSQDDEKEWHTQYLNRDSTILEIGQKVDRWLQNGDYVQIGRQPSLHKPSTMVHRVRRLPPGVLTFLVNLAVTPPYNADYDGDEMWMVVLQSYAAVMEARLLMHVPFQIVSPQSARALIGFVYHSVLAAYHLGFRHILFSREQFCQYLQGHHNHHQTIPAPAMTIKRIGARWTGKQLFSCLLPADLHFESKAGYKLVVIRNGKWLTGYWTKTALSHLVLRLVQDYGYYTAARFISVTQRMLKLFMDDYGATLGPLDLLNPCHEQTTGILNQLREPSHIKEAKEYIAQHLANTTSESSRLVHIIRSGTKGNNTNVMQLMACLGETVLLGSPIRFPTAHFLDSSSDSIAAKGFISSNFATGLKPYESFCHFASGREGILDTANKTCRIGYLQRKVARMLGDLRVECDGTVRDAEGRIVMSQFGGDGLQPSCVSQVPVRFTSLQTIAQFEAAYRHPELDREWLLYLRPLFPSSASASSMSCPIPYTRLFDHIHIRPTKGKQEVRMRMTPQVLFAHVERLFYRINQSCPAAFWDHLAVRKWPCMPTAAQWQQLEQAILTCYYPRALSKPGETVGTIAAQSIVEPAMQMTMRTFYLPGVGSINLQGGLDQLNDTCNATQGSAAPTMTCYLKPQFSGRRAEICKSIPGRFLKDVCRRLSVETQQTTGLKCPCIATSHGLLSQSAGSIRATDYFLEFELHDMKQIGVVSKALGKFFGRQLTEILDCNATIRVYLDQFHPLLNAKDANAKVSFDLILREAKDKVCISGCSKIKAAHLLEGGEGEEILLVGTGTEAVWSTPEVDMRRTLPSDIREIETLFGIDAAALIIEDKLMACMQKQGVALDRRHASLLAANMTRSGRIVPNTGLGVATESQSAIRKCTFEKMSAQLAAEAACGSFDAVKGTVEALILSAIPRMGSNYSTVYPPPTPTPFFKIPTSYNELRDVPTVAPSYDLVKRFMPQQQTLLAGSYVPGKFQYSCLQPIQQSGRPFQIDQLDICVV